MFSGSDIPLGKMFWSFVGAVFAVGVGIGALLAWLV